jgi:two-component system, response regulator / RNA-binding antiterminator
MVVDHAVERAELVQRALRSAGYEAIAHVASTFDLHRRVSDLRADVIIIDTESPDRDTLEHLPIIDVAVARFGQFQALRRELE